MIHEILGLTRPLIIPDVETTATTPQRIVEIAYQRWTPRGLDREWETLVNPEMPMPAQATEVHGITDADVIDAPKFIDIAREIANTFSYCDFAGKNVRFDLRVIAEEMKRVGVSWNYVGARIICADRIEHLGEPRDLTTLYKRRTGKDLVGAHRAINDVRATTELIESQLEYFEQLPREVQALHGLMWPDFVDAEGKIRWKAGEPVLSFGGKHNGVSLREVPRDYLKWMAGAGFPDDVKKIAMEASMDVYPIKKEAQ